MDVYKAFEIKELTEMQNENATYQKCSQESFQVFHQCKSGTVSYILQADEYVIFKHKVAEPPDVFRYDEKEAHDSEDSPLTANSDYGSWYTDSESISYICK